jgi:hypothetical protein
MQIAAKATLIVMLFPFLLGACKSIASPNYSILSKRDGYEIREYESYLVAEVEMKGSYKETLNQGFRVLFDYIRGNNERRESIEMTAPVLQETASPSETIEMTAPVLQEGRGNGYVISFVMPMKYSLETLPRPKDPRVVLREVKRKKVAALRFTWYATEEGTRKKTEALAALLARDGNQAISPYRTAQYNPPWAIPFLRRNEILVDIR